MILRISMMLTLSFILFYYDAPIIHYLDHIIIHLNKNKEELEWRGSRNKRIMIVIIHYCFFLFQMKLEKRRASSMDKIMNKLRLAQKKAQEMRSSVPHNQTDRVVRTSHKASSFLRTSQMRSLSGFFTCHAF